jgi:UDP-N-acetylmuramate dehydrogenase
LYKGDRDKALKAAIAWAQTKKLQPYNSAGCCFKNLTEKEMRQAKLDSNSWGYINDKILGLKGKTIGGAQISLKHAAFIENLGNATAKDVLSLLKVVYDSADAKIGIHPKPEIFFLGFDQQEIQQFI